MAIALTTSLRAEFGSGVTVNGFLLNSTMDDFTTKPGSPNLHGLVMGAANKIEPGKRGLSSQSPTIIEEGSGKLYMVVGAQGGPRIATGVWQTISNVIELFNVRPRDVGFMDRLCSLPGQPQRPPDLLLTTPVAMMIFRIVWFPVSAPYKFPRLSATTPAGR